MTCRLLKYYQTTRRHIRETVSIVRQVGVFVNVQKETPEAIFMKYDSGGF
jgi:hypothetical protein